MLQPRRRSHPVGVLRAYMVAQGATRCAIASVVLLLSTLGLALPGQDAGPAEELTPPPVLANASKRPGVVEVTIVAEPAKLSLVPGPLTPAYAYNGSSPGPTLNVNEGDRVIVHFRNRLAEPTTIHWHGLHIPAAMDGNPMRPVKAGGSFEYRFTIPMGTAGTYWYHPHPDHRTGHQIGMGLFGAIIVRPRVDPMPASVTDKLIILSDNRFRQDGTIDFPARTSPGGIIDEVNGREGDVLFVNGKVDPAITIRSGEVQRWRIVNASAARVYRLAIPGHTMLHIGSDGGLFERPIPITEIVVANSERVELLVRGTGAPGTQTALHTLPYDRYVPQTRPANWDSTRTLLSLRYSGEPPVAPVAIPETLRVVPPIDTMKARTTRVMVMSQGMINGHVMNMHRPDFHARLGATEIWQLENVVGMDHPFHLHGFQFQVIDRNGVPEPYRSWKDVVNVRKHETVRFVVRYDDFAGPWMYHCHILDHEDHGMMGFFQVH